MRIFKVVRLFFLLSAIADLEKRGIAGDGGRWLKAFSIHSSRLSSSVNLNRIVMRSCCRTAMLLTFLIVVVV